MNFLQAFIRLRAAARLSKLRAESGMLFVALAIPSTRPAVDITGFRMIESKVEKKQLEMKARTAQVYKLENLMALNDLEAKIWGKERMPFLLSGKLGILDSSTQNFKIHERSLVLSPDGYQFESDNVLYNSKDRNLTTDDLVRATPQKKKGNAYLKLTGQGLLIDLDENTYFLPKDVVAYQQLSKTSFFDIKSKTAKIFPEEGRANFQGSVGVKSASLALEGDKLDIKFRHGEDDGPQTPESLELTGGKNGKKKIKAELPGLEIASRGLKVQFNEEGATTSSEAIGAAEGRTKDNTILRAESLLSKNQDGHDVVILKDNVEIITGQRVATCQDATFFMDTGDITLQKGAAVKQGTQNVQGERIRLSTKNQEITVEKASGTMDKKEVFH